MAVDVVCVESFLVLARHNHFGRAAAELYITTSALSKRIHRLERQLGETLVVRDRGQCAGLTPAGEQFVQVGSGMVQVFTGVSFFSPGQPVQSGRIVIGLMGAVMDHVPASHLHVIKVCIESRCDVRVGFTGIPYGSDDVSLDNHQVDLVLTGVPPTRAGLEEALLGPLVREVVVPKDHDLMIQGHVSVHDLAKEKIIVDAHASTHWMAPWTLGDVGADLRTVALPVRTMAQIAAAVSNKAGIALVAPTVRHCLPPDLSMVPLRGAPPITVRATYRRSDQRPTLLTAIDVLLTLTRAYGVSTGPGEAHASPPGQPSGTTGVMTRRA